jgi:uncharacterized protein YcsI (UPF0317 family)
MNAQMQTVEPDGRPSRALSPEAMRMLIRAGHYQGATSGFAPGYVQGNLVILPKALAGDFLAFAHQNPKPCPVIGMAEAGSPHVPALGVSIDLRTDLPRYRVWENGAFVAELADIREHWRDDLVSFIIGCSFSFEEALIEDGIPLRHIACGANVAMYRTNIDCVPAGPFAGPMVVSMRPLTPADAIRAIQITSRFPAVHGAPVHLGDPALIGIKDLAKPDYGDPVAVKDDEIPVFWACGVTPQAVIAAAKPAFAITHAPGAMLITDKRNAQMSAF